MYKYGKCDRISETWHNRDVQILGELGDRHFLMVVSFSLMLSWPDSSQEFHGL
ncbi:hypothetical protein IQ259_12745 [Fortiea sp. LEGE XX443]|nr:hypothetical protein [Fortiea sp. LEGE XX443]